MARHTRIPSILIVLLSAGLLLLAACASSEPEATVAPAGQDTTAPTLPAPTEVAAILTPAPEPEPIVEECLVCHTDQDRLIDTADPVVEVEEESSGVG